MFRFETFWQKDIGIKCACKMLMKLTPIWVMCKAAKAALPTFALKFYTIKAYRF